MAREYLSFSVNPSFWNTAGGLKNIEDLLNEERLFSAYKRRSNDNLPLQKLLRTTSRSDLR